MGRDQRVWHFYPRSPCGERRRRHLSPQRPNRYFYPRSPCGERQCARGPLRARAPISIHALLAESDKHRTRGAVYKDIFLSTLSLRRATILPRAAVVGDLISIHALLAESDNLRVLDGSKSSIISIHALLAESDPMGRHEEPFRSYFYPRSPCGERPIGPPSAILSNGFLSTLSLRRATVGQKRLRQKLAISIHALLAESDGAVLELQCVHGNFYPRSPCGERHNVSEPNRPKEKFLSTLSLRRATREILLLLPVLFRFLSTLSLRRATEENIQRAKNIIFISIHALLAESDPVQA